MKNMYGLAFDLAKEGKKVLLVGIDSSRTKLYSMILKAELKKMGIEYPYESDFFEDELKQVEKEILELHEQGNFDFIKVDWKDSFYDLEKQVFTMLKKHDFDVVVLDSHKNTIELFVDKVQETSKVDVRHPNEFRFDNIEEVFGSE